MSANTARTRFTTTDPAAAYQGDAQWQAAHEAAMAAELRRVGFEVEGMEVLADLDEATLQGVSDRAHAALETPGAATKNPAATIESNDPAAVLRAWTGADAANAANATMDAGGWPNADLVAFEAAVRAEFKAATGAEPGFVAIEAAGPGQFPPCEPMDEDEVPEGWISQNDRVWRVTADGSRVGPYLANLGEDRSMPRARGVVLSAVKDGPIVQGADKGPYSRVTGAAWDGLTGSRIVKAHAG